MSAPSKPNNETCTTARAALQSYVIYCGPLFIAATVSGTYWLARHLRKDGISSLVLASIGLLMAGWMRGFRLRVDAGELEYRDGFYRLVRMPLTSIVSVRHRWIDVSKIGRAVRLPHLIISYSQENKRAHVLVNRLLFNGKQLRQVVCVVNAASAATPS